MAKTLVTGLQISNGTVSRADMNTATTGLAVITKLIAGANVIITSTGVDAGTGDVTITGVTAPVSSVFGRTGAVVKATGDYNFTDLAGSLAATQAPAYTGDATSVAGAVALTLATVNASIGTFNSLTVNAKGLVTAATNTAVVSTIFGRSGAVVKAAGDYNFTDLAGSLAATQAPAYTGDATSVAGATALTLATLTGLTAGTYNSVTINVKGQVTAATTVAAPVAPVSSVFGRTGAVVKAAGDYNFTDLAGSLAATQAPAYTGDATSVAGATALTLATLTGLTAGTYNSVTINVKGQVTAATVVAAAAPPVSSVFGRTGAVVKAAGDYNFTDLAGSLAAAQAPAYTGDATSVAGAVALTLATLTGLVAGTYNSVTINVKGQVTAATSVAAPVSSVFGRTGAVVKAAGDYNFTDLAGSLSAAQHPALTGDITSVAGALATTLATVNASVGTYNTVTVNAKGLVTAGSNAAVGVSSVFGRTGAVVKAAGDYNFTDLAGSLAATQAPAYTGDATSVAGAVALTLATVNASVGTYNTVTVNAKGLVTAGSNAAVGVSSVFGRAGAVVKAAGDYNFTDLAGSLAATQAPAYTGDATSVAGATTLTLATLTGLTAGTYNSVTINVKGQVTAATTVAAAAPPVTSVFGRTGAVVKAAGDYNFTDLAGSLSAAQHPALTGDITSVAGALATTLATVNASVGTYNTVTVNAKGLVTAGSNAAVGVSSVFGRAGAVVKAAGDYNFTDLAGSLSAAQHPALTGDITSVAGALATTLATLTGLTAGTYNSVTINVKGQVTAATTVAASPAVVGSVTISYINNSALVWTKPAGAISVIVIVVGAGGGGGSGSCQAAGVVRNGGGGGAGGGKTVATFSAATLPSTVTYAVGRAGPGGGAQLNGPNDGTPGGNGGASTFGPFLIAYGGQGGAGGTANTPAASAGGGGLTSTGGNGGVVSSGGLLGIMGQASLLGAGGGGGAGGVTAANVAANGGDGSYNSIYSNFGTTRSTGGVVGGAGPSSVAGTGQGPSNNTMSAVGDVGGGGGGAGSAGTGNSSTGTNGLYGSGGGGGGSGTNTLSYSGSGGIGGDGYVIIIVTN